ncbi:hypothetical protein D5R40_02035 [Okeania hirsuta]|uniref:Uncharacterized protein n=1 Tax=Okeania hirsuta TaxID=1458930 RepID=A0A3N6R5V1_9CYAN|nr:hypothetical protein D4Z78_08075 [Okeania hirsuta]RQH55466.1 hypothetical protein D5R40_02035 [Okeania hirsuta]
MIFRHLSFQKEEGGFSYLGDKKILHCLNFKFLIFRHLFFQKEEGRRKKKEEDFIPIIMH